MDEDEDGGVVESKPLVYERGAETERSDVSEVEPASSGTGGLSVSDGLSPARG